MNTSVTLKPDAATLPFFEMARDTDPHAALGRAVMMLLRHDSFNTLALRQIVPLIAGQVNRGHYFFVRRDGEITGFLGWACASEEAAEAWLENNDVTGIGDGREGPCVIFNTWVSDAPDMNSYIVRQMREVFRDKTRLVARRRYEDGRIRPIRIRNSRLS